jgi:hypothetical protein
MNVNNVGNAFKYSEFIQNHETTHTGEKPYEYKKYWKAPAFPVTFEII